jgi:hypothetical protein
VSHSAHSPSSLSGTTNDDELLALEETARYTARVSASLRSDHVVVVRVIAMRGRRDHGPLDGVITMRGIRRPALESGTRSRFEDWPEATVFQTGASHLATGFRGFSSRTASGGSELSVIADTGIATQAVFCQRVAVMVAAEKNRCLPVVAWLKPIERLSGSLLNAGRDNPGDNASVRKSNRVVYLENSSR